MICPYCNADNDKVIDSRASEGGRAIRRRRECLHCRRRFTTYERLEQTHRLVVVKRDGTRDPFQAEKILSSVQAACGKRPVSEDAKRQLAQEVEEELSQEYEREVPSRVVGERVLAKLRNLDEVSYIRYASEHYRLGSAGEVAREIEELTLRPRDVKQQQPLF